MSTETKRPQTITKHWYEKAIVPWVILGTIAVYLIGIYTGNYITRVYESRVMYEAKEQSSSARMKVDTPITK